MRTLLISVTIIIAALMLTLASAAGASPIRDYGPNYDQPIRDY